MVVNSSTSGNCCFTGSLSCHRANQISAQGVSHALLMLLLGLVLVVFPHKASALYFAVPDGPCVSGSVNTYSDGNNMTCYPTATGTSTGIFTYGGNSHWSVGNGRSATLPGARAPMTGNFTIQTYVCVKNSSPCTIARSEIALAPSASFRLRQGDIIDNITILVGGGTINLTTPYASNSCFVLRGPDGNPWKLTGFLLTCSDASSLPTESSFCAIGTSEINIDFANIERREIAISPLTSVAQHGGVQILCYGGAKTSYSMRFEYTPVAIGGNQLVSTSNPSLGVAIIYNGVVLTNTSNTNLSFNASSTLDLQFEVIRDSSVNIKSGNFTGTAVLVLTQQ